MIVPYDVKMSSEQQRAGDGVRTHDNDVGNVVLYQLSYTRTVGANYGVQSPALAPGRIPKL